MSKYKAAAFIKAGTCIRYLIDVQAGSAIGKARPNSATVTFRNIRGEKLDSDNVLENMQLIDGLLDEIGFTDVRTREREYLKNKLIPEAMLIKASDEGYGVLTDVLAAEISEKAREIRMGMLEAGKERLLYSEPDNSDKWPPEFSLKLLLTPPLWLVTAYLSTIALTLGFTETRLYHDIKEKLAPQEQIAPADPVKPKEDDGPGKLSDTRQDG